MTPESLLDKLESLDKIDPKILGKLRRQSQKPETNITIKKILSFLIKNEILTKDEAVEIKRELKLETKLKYSEGRNTDDLMAGVVETVPPPEEEVEVAEYDEPVEEDLLDSPTEIVGVGASPDMDQATLMAAEPQDFLSQPLDPIADPMASSWESAATGPSTTRSKRGFDGKLDSSDQWATKWVFIGFGVLGLLLVAGTLLTFVLSMITAVDRFDAAVKSFEDGTYGDAIKKFDEFLEKHGNHEKAPIARVTRVQALLAETFKQKNWDETVARAEKWLPPLIEDEDIDLETIRQDLGVILPNTTLAMAKRATKQDSKPALIEQLAKAKNAKKLIDDPVYIPNSRRKQAQIADLLEKIDEEIAKGDILIKKQDDFESALSEIVSLRDQGQTDQAFSVYNNLIRAYGDLRSNEQLQNEMKQVSQLEAQLVKTIDSSISPAQNDRPSAIASSIILASKTGTPIESLQGQVLPILADGSVYGLDAGDGSIRWRRFVGYQTFIQPVATESDTVLVSDQLHNDLLLVNTDDGQVVWRTEFGETFLTPQVNEDAIFLTAESGNLFRINPADGSIQASVKIPQNASVPMVRFARQKLILQPGNYSNLYILNEEDLTCQDVIYLGHQPGSIFATPVVWKNYVLICVNVSGACDLYVLRYNAESKKMEMTPQRIRPLTRGLVNSAPTRFGRFMVVNSEDGDLKILQIDSANETNPVSILDAEKFENRDNARTYLATAGSQLWVASNGIMRYKVSRSLGAFDRQVIANSDDTFIGPLFKIGESLIHVRKRSGSSMTSVSAVDGTTLQQTWRTDLGGPLAGPPMVIGDQIFAVSSQGGLYSIPANSTTNQAVSDEVKSSNIVQNLLFDETIELANGNRVCVGPTGRADLLFVDPQNRSSKLVRLPKPADEAACRPISIENDLIVASAQGQVNRVDPSNAKVIGTPFLPPVTPGEKIPWKRPAKLADNRFVIGANKSLYLIDAANNKVLNHVAQLDIADVIKSPLISADNQVFGVFQSKDGDKVLSFDVQSTELTANGSAGLAHALKGGPWLVGDRLLVRLADNSLVCFDTRLTQNWAASLPGDSLAATPVADGNLIKLFFGNGKIVSLDASNGNIESEFAIEQPIVHRPVTVDGGSLFAGSDGTIHKVDIQ